MIPISTSKKVRALGIYQILGGLFGIGLMLYMIDFLTLPPFLRFFFFIGFVLFTFSIYCGVLLFLRPALGLKCSTYNQLFQTISFSVSGYAFQYISGVCLMVGLDMTESINFKFTAGTPAWRLSINDENQLLLVSFNIFSFFLLLMIDKLQSKMSESQSEEQVEL